MPVRLIDPVADPLNVISLLMVSTFRRNELVLEPPPPPESDGFGFGVGGAGVGLGSGSGVGLGPGCAGVN